MTILEGTFGSPIDPMSPGGGATDPSGVLPPNYVWVTDGQGGGGFEPFPAISDVHVVSAAWTSVAQTSAYTANDGDEVHTTAAVTSPPATATARFRAFNTSTAAGGGGHPILVTFQGGLSSGQPFAWLQAGRAAEWVCNGSTWEPSTAVAYVYDAAAYGYLADGQKVIGSATAGGSMTIGSNLLVMQTARFTPASVGKSISVDGARLIGTSTTTTWSVSGVDLTSTNSPWTKSIVGTAISIPGAGTGGTTFCTTIASLVDSGHVILNDAVPTATSSAGTTAITWGNPAPLASIISTYISPTQVTLEDNATITVSVETTEGSYAQARIGAYNAGTPYATVIWGTENGPALTNAITDAATNALGGTVVVPSGLAVCNGATTPSQSSSKVLVRGFSEYSTVLCATDTQGVFNLRLSIEVSDITLDGGNQTGTVCEYTTSFLGVQTVNSVNAPIGGTTVSFPNNGAQPWVVGNIVVLAGAGKVLPDGSNGALVSTITAVLNAGDATHPASYTIADTILGSNITPAPVTAFNGGSSISSGATLTSISVGPNNPAINVGDTLTIYSDAAGTLDGFQALASSHLGGSTSGSVTVTDVDGSALVVPFSGITYTANTAAVFDSTNQSWGQKVVFGTGWNHISGSFQRVTFRNVNLNSVSGFLFNSQDNSKPGGEMLYPGSAFQVRSVTMRDVTFGPGNSYYQEACNFVAVHDVDIQNIKGTGLNGRGLLNLWGCDRATLDGFYFDGTTTQYIDVLNLGWNNGAGGRYNIDNVYVTDPYGVVQKVIVQVPNLHARGWYLPAGGTCGPQLNVKGNSQQAYFDGCHLLSGVSLANSGMGLLSISKSVIGAHFSSGAPKGCITTSSSKHTGPIQLSDNVYACGSGVPILHSSTTGTIWEGNVRGGHAGWQYPVPVLQVNGAASTVSPGTTVTSIAVTVMHPVNSGDTIQIDDGSGNLQNFVSNTTLAAGTTGVISFSPAVAATITIAPGTAWAKGTTAVSGLVDVGTTASLQVKDVLGITGASSAFFTSSGSWTPPPGITLVKITGVGAGGSGGGGGSTATAGQLQSGGSGAGAGQFVSRVVPYTGGAISVTVGQPGAAGIGGAPGGNAGTNGSSGGDTIASGTGISTVTAKGGSPGLGSAASSTTQKIGGAYGQGSWPSSATSGSAGSGGGSSFRGGDGIGSGGGGGGGGAASATLGGGGGSSGGASIGGAGGNNGSSGTVNGVTPADAPANTGAGGGAGGGGANSGGTSGSGGNGGNGGSGWLLLEAIA